MENPEPDREPRAAIFAVATKLFSERGFSNVSIRDICEAAGVTPPTIYHYFGSKNQLFQEIIRARLSLDAFQQTLQDSLKTQPDPVSQLCAFIYHYLCFFPRDFFNPGMFLQETTRISGLSFERVAAELEALEQTARQILQSGVAQGVFRPLDLDFTTRYLMNLLMSYVLGEVHFNQPSQPHQTALFIQAALLDGIRTHPPLPN
ncbi:MAG: TetR/AcrR family transcriptional regulator [Anaerolineales bacterium]|nr:TetR/AcrR family transcriptional regulator [Anaerolineales bacterium]